MMIARFGQFAVLERPQPDSIHERALSRPRFAVVQYDDRGPILRAGPFAGRSQAIEQCRKLSAEVDRKEAS
jgi:hypothetical protein